MTLWLTAFLKALFVKALFVFVHDNASLVVVFAPAARRVRRPPPLHAGNLWHAQVCS